MPPKTRITLFVRGRTLNNELTKRRLDEVCKMRYREDYVIDLVNVLEQPQLAEDSQILATPALLWQSPPPRWRVVGSLKSMEQALSEV
jgi:circadian clock protein KaiB